MVAVGASNTAEKFAQWGEYYAQSGVYAHAADAYGAAAATSNSPTLVYQAGCAAEMAGDVGSAVEYYARLLQATPPAPVSNKEGKTSWTEPHPSA
jgi:tetratricopeptide (TPR) repeat protein